MCVHVIVSLRERESDGIPLLKERHEDRETERERGRGDDRGEQRVRDDGESDDR